MMRSLLFLMFFMPRLHAEPLLLDAFKNADAWEIKEWGDGGVLGVDAGTLRLKFEPAAGEPSGKGIVLRRSLLGRAHEYRSFDFDVLLEAKTSMSLQASVEADRTYESKPITLQSGWNRGIHLPLESFEAEGRRLDDQMRLGTLILRFHRQQNVGGSVVLGPIRSFHKPELSLPTQARQALVPHTIRVAAASAQPDVVSTYQAMTFQVKLDGSYIDPFDEQEVDLQAEIKGPDGKVMRVPGFLYSGQVNLQTPVRDPVWKIRFTPTQSGSYSYRVLVQNRWGKHAFPVQSFQVEPSMALGFIRVDPQHPEYFRYDSGDFYYPIGQNLAWLPFDQYPHYLQRMGEQKENWARIWMSAWSFGLEWKAMGSYAGLGQYNLEKAAQLDELIELADAQKIGIQLVFDFHGALSRKVNPEWSNNPYNKQNGGFLERPEDFFTDPRALRMHQKRLRYIVARWGFSPTIMAWELFNEVSYTDNYKDEAVTAWHKTMAEYVKSIDPWKHMITTSYGGGSAAGAYKLASIDFSQDHLYSGNMVQLVKSVNTRLARYKKPQFIGEFGSASADGGDDQDKEGIFLHAGLWSQFMQNAGGNAMPWWWDTHIEPNNLYPHFGALARFAAGLDRRLHAFEPVRQKLGMGIYRFELMGLSSPEFSMYWLTDAEGLNHRTLAKRREFNSVKIALEGLPDGLYDLEFWDTRRGEVQESRRLASQKGRLELSLPPFRNDLAFKARPIKPVASAVPANPETVD